MILTIPENHASRFAKLPDEVRQEINRWLSALEEIFKSPRKTAAFKSVAPTLGYSWQHVRTMYYEFRRTGDWQVLINRAKAPEDSDKLPPEFIEWWRWMCGKFQRKSKPAFRALRSAYFTRTFKIAGESTILDSIPGYEEWPEPGNNKYGLPRGWTYENLMKNAPTKYELLAVRIGKSAADIQRELVYTSRRDLYVASHYQFDDMGHNFFINSFAEMQAGRPLELFSHDLFASRKLRYGWRVRTKKDDGSYNALTERMTRMVLAMTLFLDGYSPRGTWLISEHGTAHINEKLDKALRRDTGGLVKVAYSGMTGAKAHAGQYPGLVRGNFRFKASLESSNNLTQNEFASLPGQTGKDLASRPEELHALLKHNSELLMAYQQLPAHVAEKLEFLLLEQNEFALIARETYTAIENYTDHNLEGWEEAGNIVNEIEIAGQWINQQQVMSMPEEQQQIVLAMIEDGKLKTRPRRMSRREVWDRGAGDLIKLPGYGVCEILGDDLAAERRVVKNMFEFEDAEVGPGIHRYQSVAHDSEGRKVELRDGETYQVFVNPFAPQTLFVRDVRGGYIGECRAITDPSRGDVEAVERRMGSSAKREGELLAPVRRRHLRDANKKERMHKNNADLLGGNTPEDRKHKRAMRTIDHDAVADLASNQGERLPDDADFSAGNLL